MSAGIEQRSHDACGIASIRKAFPLIGRPGWTSKHNYLVNLLRAVDLFESSRVHPALFSGEKTDDRALAPFRAMRSVRVF